MLKLCFLIEFLQLNFSRVGDVEQKTECHSIGKILNRPKAEGRGRIICLDLLVGPSKELLFGEELGIDFIHFVPGWNCC